MKGLDSLKSPGATGGSRAGAGRVPIPEPGKIQLADSAGWFLASTEISTSIFWGDLWGSMGIYIHGTWVLGTWVIIYIHG